MAVLEAPGPGSVYRLHAEKYPSGELSVVSFRGVEEMSRPYSFRVLATAARLDMASLDGELIGRPASLRMTTPSGGTRFIHGIVRSVDGEGVSGGGDDRRHVRVWIAPKLWLLGHHKTSRIFQDLSVKDIVSRVLDESGVPHRWALVGAYAVRDYCVQHQETDLDFVSRLLAEEGISYFFEHPDEESATEMLVLSDSALLAKPIQGASEIAFNDSSGAAESGEHVRRFRLRGRFAAGAALHSEFDFNRPSFDNSAKVTGDAETLRANEAQALIYEHHGEFFGERIDPKVAALHLEQHRRKVRIAQGESRCRRLSPGAYFDLTGDPAPELDGRYTLLRVEHEGHDVAGMSRAGLGKGAPDVYRNRFFALPAGVVSRPASPPRRIQQVLETAIVVGPEGQEIYTDALGRIKVQFHWDLTGKHNEHSSCFLRTMQGWAGTGWGFQFIPRIGMEVLVQFLGGDTDRPIVLGCTYNAERPPPFNLPTDKTKSGIRTQSTLHGQGGHNEISFEDKVDAERVYLRAQRNLDELVGKDHTTTVGADQAIKIAANQAVTVGGDSVETIAGDRIGGVGGDRKQKVGGEDHLTVDGSRVVKVKGGHVSRTDGDSQTFVGGATKAHHDDRHVLRVVGKQDILIGTKDAAEGAILTVWGQYRAVASTTLSLEGQEKIVLKCGESQIVMTPDDITLVSKTVRLQCSDVAQVDAAGAQFKLDGDGYLNGKKIQIHSSGASGIFDSDARLDGSLVKLNCGPDSVTAESESEESESETKTLTLTLADGAGKPHANKRYELLVEGTTLKGTTGGDGKVTETIASSVTTAVLTLWVTDKQKTIYQIDVGTMPPSNTVRGALMRLRNLKYYTGDLMDDLDDKARASIRYFQDDQGIPNTGEVDSQTAGKLDEVSGS